MKNVYLQYVGDGSSLSGVPARDLDYDEAAQFDVEKLVSSGLYRKISNKQAPPAQSNKAAKGGSENKEA